MAHRFFEDPDDPVFNSGIKLRHIKPIIYIPEAVEKMCEAIARKIGGSEFALYCQVEHDGWKFWITDVFVPKQRAHGGHIETDENTPFKGLRAYIHRHPDSLASFSGDDDATVNVNNDISILYTANNGFCKAQLNWLLDGERYVIELEIKILRSLPDVSKFLKKIKELKPKKEKKQEAITVFTPVSEAIVNDDDDVPVSIEWTPEFVKLIGAKTIKQIDENTDAIVTYMPRPEGFDIAWNYGSDLADEKTTEYYDDWCSCVYDVVRTMMAWWDDVEYAKGRVEMMWEQWQKKEYNKAMEDLLRWQGYVVGGVKFKEIKSKKGGS